MGKKKDVKMPEPPMFKYENVQTEIEPPMNPKAKEDYRKAIKDALKNAPITVSDEPEIKPVNSARLKWTGCGSSVDDFINILLLNKYKVTVYVEDYCPEMETLMRNKQYVIVEFEKNDTKFTAIKAEAEALAARLRK